MVASLRDRSIRQEMVSLCASRRQGYRPVWHFQRPGSTRQWYLSFYP